MATLVSTTLPEGTKLRPAARRAHDALCKRVATGDSGPWPLRTLAQLLDLASLAPLRKLAEVGLITVSETSEVVARGGAASASAGSVGACSDAGLQLMRTQQQAIAAILDGMSWLGLDADEPAIFQFARAARHREAALAMIERGTAFRCYVTLAELEARRNDAMAKAQAAKDETLPEAERVQLKAEAAAGLSAFRSPYRDGLKPPAPNAPFVVRLRAPDDGEIAHDDQVQGLVSVAARDIDDLVLLRADATPTYMLAVVADDHDMKVTHVIRGDDHLTNTARQIPIYRAMGWPEPVFAHVPMIHGDDGAKLSKRHGALAVQEYRAMGYLPEALNAYLMRLGWSPGHDEVIAKEEAVAQFDLAQLGRSPSRLDADKLGHVNAHYLRLADIARLSALVREAGGWALSDDQATRLARAIPFARLRAQTIPQLVHQTFFAVRERPYPLDGAAQKVMKDEMVSRLRRLRAALANQDDWTDAALAQFLKDFAATEGVGMGQIGPALRAVLSGGAAAPDLGQTLAALGPAEALARMDDHVSADGPPA